MANEATGSADADRARLDDAATVAGLRQRDETTFCRLVEAHHGSLIRLASTYVPDRTVAEEVAQDTWIAVLHGIDRFEGRSSLRTWIHRILTKQAISRGQRERRSVPLSAWARGEVDDEPSVDHDRFIPTGRPWAGHWAAPPSDWEGDAEGRLLGREALAIVARVLGSLPSGQRTVVDLRDVQGWSSEEVCEALGISPGNQRVLLHRGRARVRAALEHYLEDERSRNGRPSTTDRDASAWPTLLDPSRDDDP